MAKMTGTRTYSGNSLKVKTGYTKAGHKGHNLNKPLRVKKGGRV